MSTWASKVETIMIAKSATFCVSHNHWIADTLDLYSQLGNDGCGLVCIHKNAVAEALEQLELAPPPDNEREDIINTLDAILADIGNDNFVEYLCG